MSSRCKNISPPDQGHQEGSPIKDLLDDEEGSGHQVGKTGSQRKERGTVSDISTAMLDERQ